MSFSIIPAIALVAWVLFSSVFTISWANPIEKYKQGYDGRAEYVHAVIRHKDLDTGDDTSVNATMAEEVLALGKGTKGGDDCGYIVGKGLGGPMRLYNLFPQSVHINQVQFKSTVEAHVEKFLLANKHQGDYVDYKIILIYAKNTSTRPIGLAFGVRFYKNNKLVKHQDIPVNGKHRVPANPYKGFIYN